MDKLLPCPFCGGENINLSDYGCNTWFVQCEDCYAVFPFFDTAREAESAWNQRAQPEREPLTIDELRQMNGEPVWIVTLDGTTAPMWEIIVSAGEYGVDLICVLNGIETRDYADFDLYGDTWLAYRRKPERSEG